MSKEVWMVTVSEREDFTKNYLSLLAKGQQMTEDNDYTLCSLFIGSKASIHSVNCAKWVDKIYCIQNPAAENDGANGYIATIEALVQKYQPEIILFPTDRFSNIISASLGIRLDTGVIAHANDMKINEDGKLVCFIPTYGGRAIGEILCPGKLPQIATAKVEAAHPEDRNTPTMLVSEQYVAPRNSKLQLRSIEHKPDTSVSLESADVVICGGGGIKTKENWEKIQLLAGRLGGAAGVSRAALKIAEVEEEQYLIGISGKTVAPRVYIGFGVSGSTQHSCGMKDSKLVININNQDTNCFFELSDYGFVGDAGDILNQLIKQTEYSYYL